MGAVARKRCIQKLCWQNPSREAGETKISKSVYAAVEARYGPKEILEKPKVLLELTW
jgi:hypothetical protein